MIKGVLLDLDDTLYDYQSLNEIAVERLQEFCQARFGIPKARFQEAYQWSRQETKKVLEDTAAGHNRILYFQKLLEYLHKNPISYALEMYDVYWSAILELMVLNPGVEKLLKYCKDKTIKVGIGTDLTAHIQHRKLKALGIDHYIDAIVTSEEAGKEKPDIRLFRMLLSKLQITSKEAVYIGDSLKKDVLGAKAAGIHAVWYTKEVCSQYVCIDDFNKMIPILECDYGNQ